MKFRKTAKNGLSICATLSLIALTLLFIINIIPNVDPDTLNITDRFEYDMGVYEGETPLWKKICNIILLVLFILNAIIDLVMCRCNYCGRYIRFNNSMKYCPYCSKDLDKTEKEIDNEIKDKKE